MATQNQTLVVYDKITDPVVYAKEMERACESFMGAPVGQGRAIALHALCMGLTIPQMAQRYHWIDGRATMRADAMLSEFRMNHGGEYKKIHRTEEIAEIEFRTSDGTIYQERFTWEEAKQEAFVWIKGKGPGDDPTPQNLKANWSTPRARKQMLWARLVSDSLRWICPEMVAGIYTPEEMGDLSPERADSGPRAVVIDTKPAAEAGPSGSEPEAVDAPFDVVEESPEESPPDPDAPGSIRSSQADQIAILFEDLGFSPDKREEILRKRQAKAVRNLSADQAAEIIERLKQAIDKRDSLGK